MAMNIVNSIINLIVFLSIYALGGVFLSVVTAWFLFIRKKRKTRITLYQMWFTKNDIDFKDLQLVYDFKTESCAVFGCYIWLLIGYGIITQL